MFKINKRRKSIEDDEEEEFEDRDQEILEENDGIESSKLGLLKDRVTSTNKKILTNDTDNDTQTFTQRLVEKNKQRKQRNQNFKKDHDLKLAFSEFVSVDYI